MTKAVDTSSQACHNKDYRTVYSDLRKAIPAVTTENGSRIAQKKGNEDRQLITGKNVEITAFVEATKQFLVSIEADSSNTKGQSLSNSFVLYEDKSLAINAEVALQYDPKEKKNRVACRMRFKNKTPEEISSFAVSFTTCAGLLYSLLILTQVKDRNYLWTLHEFLQLSGRCLMKPRHFIFIWRLFLSISQPLFLVTSTTLNYPCGN